MNRVVLVFIFISIMGTYQYWTEREVPHPPGILIKEEPQQKALHSAEKPIKYKGLVLDPLAEYRAQGRVLSTEHYWIDKMAPIAPIDLALGWGVMSDTKVLKELKIWQEDRFYFYSWQGTSPVEPGLMVRSSANMHLIPSTDYLEKEIKKLRKGQLVLLTGLLVRVNYPDGSEAKSSLTREDSGAGACEIMWVESLQII
ncbi:MAG: hypothetical protein ACXVB1_10280 [Pseudobdellovibrionaceae bacterium]